MLRIITQVVFMIIIMAATAYPFEPFFDSRVDYPMGGYIECMTNADFNNDGFIDFACGSDTYTGETFTHLNVYINHGDGTYLAPVEVESGPNIAAIIHGDFNGDGWTDLATVTDYSDLNIIMNQGDGTLVWERRYSDIFSSRITVIDFNNDGYDDILQNAYPNINILFSNGDGTFAVGDAGQDMLQFPMDVVGNPINWNVNDDEYEDLLIWGFKFVYTTPEEYYQQPTIATFVNNGDSSFQAGVEYLHGSSGTEGLYGFETGYFNSDSDKDLLISDFLGNRVVLISNGNGSFKSNFSFMLDYLIPITCGDINRDDFSDIIISDSENTTLSVMQNNADDQISFTDPVDYPGKWGTNLSWKINISSSDLNNDNYDDIILSQFTISTILNHRDGTFPIFNPITNMGIEAFDMLTEDFNSDGSADLITIDENLIYLSYNDGNGNFADRQTLSIGLSDPRGIFSGYFDSDEFFDFAVAGTDGLILFYGQEAGGFQQGTNLADSLGFVAGYGGLAADLNDDGFMDFATYYSGNYDLNIVLSNSTGTYHLDAYNLPNMPNVTHKDIAVADIDLDNDLDIVIGSANGAIYVNFNDGDGGFQTYSTIPTEYWVMGIVLQDLNDDGYADIAATQLDSYDGYVSVHLNNGDGTFASAAEYGRLYSPWYENITFADMDGDGDPDLLATIKTSSGTAVFVNEGDGTFPEIQYYSGGGNPVVLAVNDFNSDLTYDIAALSTTENENYVYLYLNSEQTGTPIAENEVQELLPITSTLFQNYPNPFNPTTAISYQLSAACQVDLSIYNVLGQKVTTLVSEEQPVGVYHVKWDASSFSSGLYFYQLKTGVHSSVRKMMFMR